MPRALNVLAIVRAEGPTSIRTRSGHSLKRLTWGPVAAVVREVTRPPAMSPAQLRVYERNMRELAERFSALLPARFATVMPADELRIILASRRREFQRALGHVHGKSQMTVRVPAASAVRRTSVSAGAKQMPRRDASHVSGTRSASGRDYLRARAREAAERRRVPGFEPVRAAVARWVRDERVEHRGGVSTIYHLVPRRSSERYRQALLEAAAAAALPAVVTGPWPPYAFAAGKDAE